MSKYKGVVVICEDLEFEVEAEDETEAENKMLELAQKSFLENGISNPDFTPDFIDEILE